MSLMYDKTNIKLVFLDTNALSEFISNNKNFRNNILSYLKDIDYEFCFNANNILELKKGYLDRYNSFIDLFSNMPCIFFKLYPTIIKEEAQYANTKSFNYSNIAYSVVPNLIKQLNFNYVLHNIEKDFGELNENEEKNLLNFFNNKKENNSNFVKLDTDYELQMINDTLKQWNLKLTSSIDLNNFPAIRMINKSTYNRIVRGKKEKIKRNDINDIMISSVTPYVDIIVTERYQLNIIKEAKQSIPQIQKLECHKISDFYDK